MALNDNRRRIRFRRGTNDQIVSSKNTEKIVYGQPVFNSTKNYLSIGEKPANGQSDTGKSAKDLQPINVRKVNGWYSDNDGIKAVSDPTISDYSIYGYLQGNIGYLDIKSSQSTNLINNNNILLTLNNEDVNKEISINDNKYLYSKDIRTNNIGNILNTDVNISLTNAQIQLKKNTYMDSGLNLTLQGTGKVIAPNLEVTTNSSLKGTTTLTGTLNIGSSSSKATSNIYSTTTLTGNTTINGITTYGTGVIKLDYSKSSITNATSANYAFYSKTSKLDSIYVTDIENKVNLVSGATLKGTTTLSSGASINNGSNLQINQSDNSSKPGLKSNYGNISNLTSSTAKITTLNVNVINLQV